MSTDTNSDSSWHLDKKVPVALILVLFIHAATGVWWASKMESRQDSFDQRLNEQRIKDQQQDGVIIENRNERNSRLDRIENKLDNMIIRLGERPAKAP